MVEQMLVCDCHLYKSLVCKCQKTTNSENVFARANTSALNVFQMGTRFDHSFLPKTGFERLGLSLLFT